MADRPVLVVPHDDYGRQNQATLYRVRENQPVSRPWHRGGIVDAPQRNLDRGPAQTSQTVPHAPMRPRPGRLRAVLLIRARSRRAQSTAKAGASGQSTARRALRLLRMPA